MRRKNWRIVIVGFVLIVLALGFYFFMLSIASTSNDPAALMQTVGTVAGAAVGISLVMIILGLIGKKVWSKRPKSKMWPHEFASLTRGEGFRTGILACRIWNFKASAALKPIASSRLDLVQMWIPSFWNPHKINTYGLRSRVCLSTEQKNYDRNHDKVHEFGACVCLHFCLHTTQRTAWNSVISSILNPLTVFEYDCLNHPAALDRRWKEYMSRLGWCPACFSPWGNRWSFLLYFPSLVNSPGKANGQRSCCNECTNIHQKGSNLWKIFFVSEPDM